jgi:hypothetical protein
MRAAAAASGDKEIRRQYNDWLAARQLLAAALMSDGPPAPLVSQRAGSLAGVAFLDPLLRSGVAGATD